VSESRQCPAPSTPGPRALPGKIRRRRDPGGARTSSEGAPALYTASVVSDHRAALGESPIWDGRVLRWLDITGQKMFTLEPDGRVIVTNLDTVVTAIALRQEGGLLAATRTGLGWLDEASGNVETRLEVLRDESMTMNDGAVDALGRFWVGSASLDETDRGALYRLSGGRLDTVATNITMSNGIGWSPGGRVLYHVDTGAGTVTAWTFSAAGGAISDPRTFQAISPEVGLPDGLAVDGAGNVWLAVWGAGEVWGLDGRSGQRIATVSVPTPCASSCAFGGPAMDTLYITTAADEGDPGGGMLYSARLDVTAAPSHRFRGTL
jgi:sugar lactone lactonase YvrE